jgi:hypothetical protein
VADEMKDALGNGLDQGLFVVNGKVKEVAVSRFAFVFDGISDIFLIFAFGITFGGCEELCFGLDRCL